MMQFEKYTEYAVEQAKKLLAIDSPSGYGYYVTEYLLKEFAALGIPARRTIKGGVIADFGGKEDENGILLEAHCDTLGGMVSQIKENGRLKLTNIGGMKPANAEAENVRIITKGGITDHHLSQDIKPVGTGRNKCFRDSQTCKKLLAPGRQGSRKDHKKHCQQDISGRCPAKCGIEPENPVFLNKEIYRLGQSCGCKKA